MEHKKAQQESWLQQRTLKRWVSVSDLGLHTGRRVELFIGPAPENHGIVFERVDLRNNPKVAVHPANIVDSALCTSVENKGVRVSTVEHLLAAFTGLGVDNARVLLNAEEVPILDGSASPFVRLLREAGLRRLDAPRAFWQVTKPVTVRDGDRSIRVLPSSRFSVDCTLDFDHPLISDQRHRYFQDPDRFERDIAPARTFGFVKDIDALRKAGLAKGGSLDNAVVVDSFSILNPGGLRFPDEFARHKVLDILGDLALLGGGLAGRVVAVKSGHQLHRSLVRQLVTESACCRRVHFMPGSQTAALPFDLATLPVGNLQEA